MHDREMMGIKLATFDGLLILNIVAQQQVICIQYGCDARCSTAELIFVSKECENLCNLCNIYEIRLNQI